MSETVFFGPSPSEGLCCDHEARGGGLDAGNSRPTLKGDAPHQSGLMPWVTQKKTWPEPSRTGFSLDPTVFAGSRKGSKPGSVSAWKIGGRHDK